MKILINFPSEMHQTENWKKLIDKRYDIHVISIDTLTQELFNNLNHPLVSNWKIYKKSDGSAFQFDLDATAREAFECWSFFVVDMAT